MRRNKLYIALWSFAAMLVVTGCDEVPANERIINVEPPQVNRAILIEDYTGQYCVNCPRATQEIERLVEEYGDSVVIAVAIHSGPFSKQKGIASPLYTEVGDTYFNHWNLSAQPIGIIDRLPYPLDFTDWAWGVNYELEQHAPVAFLADTRFDNSTRGASIEIQTIGLDSTAVSGKLQVWLVEDSIDSFQYMPDGSVSEHYNHMHVFRSCVNDVWGEPLEVNYGEVSKHDYQIALSPAWIPEHCAFIVFLDDGNGVRQVSKFKIINDNKH